MAHQHPGESMAVRVVTITVSDTRTARDDTSGDTLRALLAEGGYHLGAHHIVPDEPAKLRELVTGCVDRGECDAVVTTGGTGIAPRDQTYEAMTALLEKTLDGFGEAFRQRSWDEIGPRAMLSRAVAGTYHGAVIVALPGSTAAVRLGVGQLVVPMLRHAVAIAKG